MARVHLEILRQPPEVLYDPMPSSRPASLLPTIQTWDDYRALRARPACFDRAIEIIAQRHRVPGLEGPITSGTQVVYMARSHVIKLFIPLSLADHAAERVGLVAAAGALPVETPAVEAEGELEGWPYFVMSRLSGSGLASAWSTLPSADRLHLIARAGELAAALHRLAVPPDAPVPDARPLLGRPIAEVIAKHRKNGVSPSWLHAIQGTLEGLRPVATLDRPPVLLHCDLYPEHLMFEVRNGRPEVSGLFDFGDTMIGPPEYDLAATAILMACHEPGGLHTMLTAYGYEPRALDEQLGARLVRALLGQRYCALPQILPMVPEPRRPTTVEALTRLITDFAAPPRAGGSGAGAPEISSDLDPSST